MNFMYVDGMEYNGWISGWMVVWLDGWMDHGWMDLGWMDPGCSKAVDLLLLI